MLTVPGRSSAAGFGTAADTVTARGFSTVFGSTVISLRR
jgi:hypothetical protein